MVTGHTAFVDSEKRLSGTPDRRHRVESDITRGLRRRDARRVDNEISRLLP